MRGLLLCTSSYVSYRLRTIEGQENLFPPAENNSAEVRIRANIVDTSKAKSLHRSRLPSESLLLHSTARTTSCRNTSFSIPPPFSPLHSTTRILAHGCQHTNPPCEDTTEAMRARIATERTLEFIVTGVFRNRCGSLGH